MRSQWFFFRVVAPLIFACLIAGCGQTPTPEPTATVRPAQVATQAPQPTAAVPPTAPAGVPTQAPTTAPTKPPSTPTVSGQVTAARTVEISALWFATDPKEGPIGGTSRVRITVEPNPTKEFRVGFFESEVGGSGPMWRASGWMAGIVAAMLTGFNPATTQISFDVSGRIDGPSAGCLMTVGVLAALRGDKISDDATMTGTINPDGTIGPVGGIPQKIEGAAKAGKKLVLVPAGLRTSMDMKTNKPVDVVEVGRQKGVEVREVADIYEAYQALTGKQLPRPTGAARPETTGSTFDRMRAKVREWFARYQEASGRYQTLPDDARIDYLEGLMGDAKTAADRANRLLDQGLVSGAYSQALWATVNATLAAETGRILEVYYSQGTDGAIKQLNASATVGTKVAAMADRLKAEKPKTLSDAAALISAYSVLIESIAFSTIADNDLQKKPQDDEEALEIITRATLFYRLADLDIEAAKDTWDVGSGLGGTPLPENVNLDGVATFFLRAAEANLNLFESVVINEQIAKPKGMSLELAKDRFLGIDLSYALARSSVDLLPMLDRYFGGGAASSYARLGGAIAAYGDSSGLIAKYYSLNAELDEDLYVTSIGYEKPFLNMLDLAEAQAREGVAGLRKNGVDPSLAIISYESARLDREGQLSEKLTSLTEFWDTYIHSRAMAYLGGFADK